MEGRQQKVSIDVLSSSDSAKVGLASATKAALEFDSVARIYHALDISLPGHTDSDSVSRPASSVV